MICERCGHAHVESIKGWATATLAFEECIANLRADLAASEADRTHLNALLGWIEAVIGSDPQPVSDFAQSFPLVRAACDLVADRHGWADVLAESRRKELDAETRACAAEERAARSGWARCVEYEREVTVLRAHITRLEAALQRIFHAQDELRRTQAAWPTAVHLGKAIDEARAALEKP